MSKAILKEIPATDIRPSVTYRVAGEEHLLVEYGEMTLDLNLRFRIHALMEQLKGKTDRGILELIPGVRTLLVKYDPFTISLKKLSRELVSIEESLPRTDTMALPSRRIKLPLAFHERWTREAIAKYTQSVRSEAPYLPDNVEFVARCNGLDGPDRVLEYLTGTELMVLGLGDVYLGAPCAVPLDPRRRLVVPKYNPARTFTPEGGVGIGGTYICIYPMASPGGYQLVGRTLPIWNTFQTTTAFGDSPWLLRFFDRIQFTPVSEDELEQARASMLSGDYKLETAEGTFQVQDYNKLVTDTAAEAGVFKERQRTAAAAATKGY